MKRAPLFIVVALVLAAPLSAVQAQARIWRCGNEYTNNDNDAKSRGCKLVEGGNVTVVSSNTITGNTAGGGAVRSPGAAAPTSTRVDSADQKARDRDARAVLEAELRKAESRQAQLLKEYNNGEPEKQGIESRNYQRYLDRVAEMKATIARNDADIEGLKRELSRYPVQQ